ncbi:hypothetical protein OIU84_011188 [Salix udensis]|uniref:Mitochondrial glycoprotein family protein n=1 Tax=Salix udensis TaxID=889485 RepID=A0AAD6NWE2_9ROSI|nr:hypothetical protein OIU84_011188 [Salix udensis]
MAFNSVLRRASKCFLPLAIRTVGSLRTVQRAIPTVLFVENRTTPRTFLPFSHFSTAATAEKPTADGNLIRVLESEIECIEEPQDEENIPNDFPFKIEDNPGERTISLNRKFQDETIKIEVDMPNVSIDVEDADDNTKDSDVSSIPLVVSISKGSGQFMEFGITAFPDEITIDSLSIKNPENSDELAYAGPDFNDLDENLQNAFHKHLEIRGIKPSTTNVLFDYMANKDNKEYLLWLKNLKNFVEM